MRYNKDPAVRGRWYCLISHGCSEEEAKARIQAAAAKKKREEDVLRKMERQKSAIGSKLPLFPYDRGWSSTQ